MNNLFCITDKAKQFSSKKKVAFEDIWNNIKNLQNKGFNIDNLVQLLQHMNNLCIYATADAMCLMLKFFKDYEKDLKFNKANNFILQLTSSPKLDTYSGMTNFISLLSFIIENTNHNENDTLTLDAILKKMGSCACSDMIKLLKLWNNAKKNKQQPVNIANILDNICDINTGSGNEMLELLAQLTDDQKKKAFSDDKNNQDNEDNKMSLTDKILNKLKCYPSAEVMVMLAQQLKDWLTEDNKRKILSIALNGCQSAEGFCELLEQLNLEMIECKNILDKLYLSQATDVLKLINSYLINNGFVWGENCYKCIFNYLNDRQSVDDVFNLLTEFKQLGIQFKDDLIKQIIDNLKSISKVKDFALLIDQLSSLNKEFKSTTVNLILNKFRSDQSVSVLIDLVKCLKSYKIEGIISLCRPIILLLSKGKNRASDGTELLINLCKLVKFECGKADLRVCLVLEKLGDNQQSIEDIIALAKVLIVMDLNIMVYANQFRKKTFNYQEDKSDKNQQWKELFSMKYQQDKYKQKRIELKEQLQKKYTPESENLNNDKVDDSQRINSGQSDPSSYAKKNIVNLNTGYDITRRSEHKDRVIANGSTANLTSMTGVSNKK